SALEPAGEGRPVRRAEGSARADGAIPDDPRRAESAAPSAEFRAGADRTRGAALWAPPLPGQSLHGRPARTRPGRRRAGRSGPAAAARPAGPLTALPRDGLPNYFDDQRFGSVAPGSGFIAQAWLRDDAERALWLAIAEPNPSDRPDIRKEKAILSDRWGRWAE